MLRRTSFSIFSYLCRVFDLAVADAFDKTVNHGTAMKDKCFRSRNNNDIVTRIPPLPYKHVGTEIYFDRL